MIDPHVHCRDWNQRHKETIEHALGVAERIGLSGIFDMPNTDPPINSRELIERRLEDARKIASPVFYGLYAGLTSNPVQIKEAVQSYRDFFPENQEPVGVIGLKMFAGHSVGNLGIVDKDEQKIVYQILANEGYDGVLAVHCEKESLLNAHAFDPSRPESHCDARPPESEYESVKDQITFAEENDFPGNLHILHVSSPESVGLVDRAKQKRRIKVTCGVTPHHCRLSREMVRASSNGLLYKVNPPLRHLDASFRLLSLLKSGHVNFIETDHAPHTFKEKTESPYLSGFPGLPYYPYFLEDLRNMGFQEEQIRELTHNNINRTFGLNIPMSDRKPDLKLHRKYEVDVYQGMRK